jgi:hypothetical protein
MAPFIFTCPNTNMSVQHSFDDDDENAGDTEYEAITCPACTRLHLINLKTGKLLAPDTAGPWPN